MCGLVVAHAAAIFQTAILSELDVDAACFEDILAFSVGGFDANRGPLPEDGLRRYVIAIGRPELTLSGVVRGMLGNQDCQNDVNVRQRYSEKVFSVLRLVAKALQRLHAQGFVHGDVCLENCGKYEDEWKLSNILGAQKVGETFCHARLSSSAPPEAVGTLPETQAAFRIDLVVHPSLDSWAFGKLAYEVLVGDALIEFNVTKSVVDDHESLANLFRWSDFNVKDAQEQLNRIGISESGVSMVANCLSPYKESRPSMDEVLKHPVWSELRRRSQAKM